MMSRFLSKKLERLIPYVPGEQPKERQYIKLNTNESPFSPSPLAIKYASEEAIKCNLYSDPEMKELTLAVANRLGVKNSQVLMTNGSDEILNFAFMAYCDKDTPAVFADLTYGFYKVFADLYGVEKKIIPLEEDFTLDITKYFNAGGTVFIANPNAPTGICLPLSSVEEIVKNNPNNVVVIDQAYVDFGAQSAVELVDKYDNLLVTETFSKSRSLAGARLGYGVASEKIIADLNAVKYSTNPYNVNRMTAKAGLGSVLDEQYFKQNINAIIKNREYTVAELKNLGFTVLESKANFIFAKSDRIGGQELYEKLREKGVLVRHFTTERIKDFNRVSIGSLEQMNSFIEAVKEILKEKYNEKGRN